MIAGLGALPTSANVYLSFLHYPLHHLRQREADEPEGARGISVIGSLLLWLSISLLLDQPALAWTVAVFSIIDTGGLHWFGAAIFWHWLKR